MFFDLDSFALIRFDEAIQIVYGFDPVARLDQLPIYFLNDLRKPARRQATQDYSKVGVYSLRPWTGRDEVRPPNSLARHPTIATAARLAGHRGVSAFGEAGPDELPDIVRRHWEVGNRVHHVRDFSHGEDRCRAAAAPCTRRPHCLHVPVHAPGQTREPPPRRRPGPAGGAPAPATRPGRTHRPASPGEPRRDS